MASNLSTIGNYRLLKELASGAFGRVYRAEHLYLADRVVAVKVLHAHLSSEKERESFLHEAQILSRLQHTHILPVIDVGVQDGVPYMITEFAQQGSLRDHIHRQAQRILPLEDALRILSQLAQALQVAHQQQIVHRDLKPENVLFHANNNALLADFGISAALSSMSVQVATITGTPPYMAPEQFKGNVSKESDQYALGCIAYELVTGRLPFIAPDFFSMAMKHMTELPPPPLSLNARLPAHISEAILKALAKERHDRYSDVIAFVSALGPFKKDFYTSTPSTSQLATTQRGAQDVPKQIVDLNYVNEVLEKGIALNNLGRYREALVAYEEAIKLKPQHADAYKNKGTTLYNLQRNEEAVMAYDAAIRLNPRDTDAYFGKGTVLDVLQRHEEALVTYEAAIRLKPGYADAYFGKGNALRALQRYEEAVEAYEEAIRLNPQDVVAYSNKEMLLNLLNRRR